MYLLHAKSVLVHITQVEHRLRVMLLLRCQTIMHGSRFVVDFGAVTVVMIITEFHARDRIAFKITITICETITWSFRLISNTYAVQTIVHKQYSRWKDPSYSKLRISAIDLKKPVISISRKISAMPTWQLQCFSTVVITNPIYPVEPKLYFS